MTYNRRMTLKVTLGYGSGTIRIRQAIIYHLPSTVCSRPNNVNPAIYQSSHWLLYEIKTIFLLLCANSRYTVNVTGCDFENSFSFDTTVENTNHMRFLNHRPT